MVKKPDKIKLSDHQRRRMAEDEGHNYQESATEFLLDRHDHSGVQEDGRLWFWGQISAKPVLTICSSTASGTYSVYRVVTTHIRRKLRRQHRPPKG